MLLEVAGGKWQVASGRWQVAIDSIGLNADRWHSVMPAHAGSIRMDARVRGGDGACSAMVCRIIRVRRASQKSPLALLNPKTCCILAEYHAADHARGTRTTEV